MPWSHPNPCAQQVEPKGFPSEDDRGRRDPLLPPLRKLEPAAGTKRWGDSKASGGGTEWWQASSGELSTEPGVGVWGTLPHLPALRVVPQRAEPNRKELRSLQLQLPLPHLFPEAVPRTLASLCPWSGECNDFRRGSVREAQDSLDAHLGEFWQPQPPKSQHQRGVSEHGQYAQCPKCSFLPDLRSHTSSFQNSLKEVLLHQIPTPRSDHAQLTMTKNANNRAHSRQAPKLKAMLTHNSSGEGSGHRRRYCPFRVHFADETVQDIALRYWERSYALHQGVETGPAAQPAASEHVFDSVGRWLESLPKALYPSAQEEAEASSPISWDCLGLPIPEWQSHFSEDTCMNSSTLPSLPSATTQRPQTDLKAFLGTHSALEPAGKSPCSWNQKLEPFLPHLLSHKPLKHGHPKGHQLLLPSVTLQWPLR